MEVKKVKSLTEIHHDIRYLKLEYNDVTLSTEKLFLNKKLFLVDYSYLDSISLHKISFFILPKFCFISIIKDLWNFWQYFSGPTKVPAVILWPS